MECPACTFSNAEGMLRCEICGTSLDISGQTVPEHRPALNVASAAAQISMPQLRCTVCTFNNAQNTVMCSMCSCVLEASAIVAGDAIRDSPETSSNAMSRASAESLSSPSSSRKRGRDSHEQEDGEVLSNHSIKAAEFHSNQATDGLIELLESALEAQGPGYQFQLTSPCTHLTQRGAVGQKWA
jgi:ribosomal protein S27E